MDLRVHIESQEGKELVRLEGRINEDAEVVLPELLEKITGNCIFHFQGVESINSCGIRAWIHFIREAEKKGSHEFVACTPDVVSQMNMIPNFRGTCKVQSVYAGYMCGACDHRQAVLLEAGVSLPQKLGDKIPDVTCPKCGAIMEMEEMEEEFFGWLEGA